jgi:hypothetical protein
MPTIDIRVEFASGHYRDLRIPTPDYVPDDPGANPLKAARFSTVEKLRITGEAGPGIPLDWRGAVLFVGCVPSCGEPRSLAPKKKGRSLDAEAFERFKAEGAFVRLIPKTASVTEWRDWTSLGAPKPILRPLRRQLLELQAVEHHPA